MAEDMPIKTTILYALPAKSIAKLIKERILASRSTSIVTGFATHGGLAILDAALKYDYKKLDALIVGAATYPLFQAFDTLIANGISPGNLYVHLGRSRETYTRKNPFVRYHPMLHSKIYYMEFENSTACAFVGSHNATTFALEGQNGEASVMLEGPVNSQEFEKIRQHIDFSRSEAVVYSSSLKEGYAWWLAEFLDGLKLEVAVPRDWQTIRTILAFVDTAGGAIPRPNETIYFDLPSGIQIESLRTEVHLYCYQLLPATSLLAIQSTPTADAKFICITLGADNEQGNLEIQSDWYIDGTSSTLKPVPTGRHRPAPQPGMQQVRAKIKTASIDDWEYAFEREKVGWDPIYSEEVLPRYVENGESGTTLDSAQKGSERGSWKLVKGLNPRTGAAVEIDQDYLALASPESGSFIVVSLRRRKIAKTIIPYMEINQ